MEENRCLNVKCCVRTTFNVEIHIHKKGMTAVGKNQPSGSSSISPVKLVMVLALLKLTIRKDNVV